MEATSGRWAAPFNVGMTSEHHDARGTVTIHSARAHVVARLRGSRRSTSSSARWTPVRCRIDRGGSGSRVSTTSAPRPCPGRGREDAVRNATPRQQVVMAVSLSHAGRVKVEGLDLEPTASVGSTAPSEPGARSTSAVGSADGYREGSSPVRLPAPGPRPVPTHFDGSARHHQDARDGAQHLPRTAGTTPIPQQERVGCASRRRKTVCRPSVPAATLLRDEHHDAAHPPSRRSGTTCPARAGCCCPSVVASSSSAPVWCCPFHVVYLHEVRGFALSDVGLLLGAAAADRAARGRAGRHRRSTGSAPGGILIGVLTLLVVGDVVLAFAATPSGRRRWRSCCHGIAFGVSWPASQSLIAAVGPRRAAPALLRGQLHPAQPRHRDRRHHRRPVRRRRRLRHLPDDLPRRRRDLPPGALLLLVSRCGTWPAGPVARR